MRGDPMRVAIVYSSFLDAQGKERAIGGIETYLLQLAQLCAKRALEPTIWQYGARDFQAQVGPIAVVGVPVPNARPRKRIARLVRAATQAIDLEEDLLIFGADRYAVPIGSERCISIQHGIAWDLPAHYSDSNSRIRRVVGDRFYQVLRRRIAIRAYERCPNRVCVDYNFLNWYRTFVHSDLSGRNWVIPNFTPQPSEAAVAARASSRSPLRILFARRFQKYRGTRIMAEAARRILDKHPDVQFTFAGEGPDEPWLRDFFRDENRVRFTRYLPDEVLDIHLEHDIAVVPSLASEGTSLSVAEAMGCGCAVVATAVGGITNMIIDGYNGLLCFPSARHLQEQLEDLICDGPRRLRLGAKAYETAKEAFSLERWEQSWSRVISEVARK